MTDTCEGVESIFCTCLADFAAGSAELVACIANAEEEARSSLATGLNSFFLCIMGALVYFMQPGFAMLCAGSIRAKNTKNVILWNLLDSAGGGLAYWAVGYAFAYGGDDADGPKTFIGNTGFFLQNTEVNLAFWFFQFAFASALSSIVAGTIAERTQMKAYLLYSVFLAGFVYPVVSHAYWSANGFLSAFSGDPLWNSGIIDLAGSGPVHMCGGVAALAAALILGPRMGRFHDKDGNPLDEPAEIPPHSVTLQFMGTFFLWFGWYGFNPGSVLATSSEELGQTVALATANTTLSACAGAVSAMFTSTILDYYYQGYHTYDLGATMNGCLAGLAAITSPCATVDTWAAVIIGMVAGWVYLAASKLMIKLRIDDAVDAIPVHMFGGAWGVLSAGLFSKPDLLARAYPNNVLHPGWFYGDGTLFGIQVLGVLFAFGWTFTVMGAFFYFLNYMGWLRIDPLEEEVGMDISRHKGSCYVFDNIKDEHINELKSSRHKGAMLDDRSNDRSINGRIREPGEAEAPEVEA